MFVSVTQRGLSLLLVAQVGLCYDHQFHCVNSLTDGRTDERMCRVNVDNGQKTTERGEEMTIC